MRVKGKRFARLLFFWIGSFAIATAGYYLLYLLFVRPVFGSFFYMLRYHNQHPVQYIAIPCFFYGIVATIFSRSFSRQNTLRQILLTLAIAVLTYLLSLPFGGMLWNYHDMQAGFFPARWVSVMITKGTEMGFSTGWVVILASIPYNLFGLVVCFFQTRYGARLFKPRQQPATGTSSLA